MLLTSAPERFGSVAAGTSLAVARDAIAAAAALELDASWEGGREACARLATALAGLRACELALRGLLLAARERRAEDGEAAVAGAQSSAAAALRTGGDRMERHAAALAAEHAAVLRARSASVNAMDERLGGHTRELGAAAAALLECLYTEHRGGGDDADVDATRLRLAARLGCAVAAFDAAVTESRLSLFYSSGGGDGGGGDGGGDRGGEEASASHQAEVEASLAIHGLPQGRYLTLFCVGAFAAAVRGADTARAAAAAAAAGSRAARKPQHVAPPPPPPPPHPSPPPPPPPPPLQPSLRVRALRRIAPWGLPPDASRCVYAAKLTAAVIAASSVGLKLFGTAVWAAFAVSFIGPRDGVSKHAGGSFRTAALRLAGTVAGAFWGFFVAGECTTFCGVCSLARALDRSICPRLFSLSPRARSSPVVTVGPDNPFDPQSAATAVLLAVWVLMLGFVRASPRHTYGGMVREPNRDVHAMAIQHMYARRWRSSRRM